MVNVFGEEDQAKDGKDGKDALPITKWFPKQVLGWWRDQSAASFYFDDTESGFIYKDDRIVGLKNHATIYDAISEGEVGKLEKLEYGYCLQFKNSLYSIPQMSLADYIPTTSCVTISFLVPTAPKEREYIISANNGRAISIEGDKIQVWGCKNEPIEIPLQIDMWNIVFVQWKSGGDYAGYIYQRVEGTHIMKQFTTTELETKPGLYIGKNFNGSICAIDITNHYHGIETATNIPIEVRDLLIKDHTDRTF